MHVTGYLGTLNKLVGRKLHVGSLIIISVLIINVVKAVHMKVSCFIAVVNPHFHKN